MAIHRLAGAFACAHLFTVHVWQHFRLGRLAMQQCLAGPTVHICSTCLSCFFCVPLIEMWVGQCCLLFLHAAAMEVSRGHELANTRRFTWSAPGAHQYPVSGWFRKRRNLCSNQAHESTRAHQLVTGGKADGKPFLNAACARWPCKAQGACSCLFWQN